MERRCAEQDVKFAEQGSKIERRFAEQEKRTSDLELAISDKFVEQDLKFERRFREQDSKFDTRFNNLERELGSLKSVARINTAIMFLLLANVALPALSKFLS